MRVICGTCQQEVTGYYESTITDLHGWRLLKEQREVRLQPCLHLAPWHPDMERVFTVERTP